MDEVGLNGPGREGYRKPATAEEIEAMLLKALEGDKSIEVTPEYWEEKKRRLRERFSRKTS